jgi:hypothetical protein|tara:strand:- start:1291 stop:1623 length:333 start_codon:yes stop_codon:yes gene_type:complete
MPTTLAQKANDSSTFVITVAYFDEDDSAVIPNSVDWTLSDEAGTTINSRSAVSIATPGTTNNIVLVAADLQVSDSARRVLLVDVDYDSAYGSGLKFRDKVTFDINDLLLV